MNQKSHFTQALTSLIVTAIFVSGCSKKRDAALPEDAQESVFAISEFGDLQIENNKNSLNTDTEQKSLTLSEASKATSEKGLVAVTRVDAPQRLRFMFKGLEIQAKVNQSYPLTFSVDRQFVTAYKIVSDPTELSILEKQLAVTKDEVALQKQIQRTKDNSKIKSLLSNLREAQKAKVEELNKRNTKVLVPLFKYRVANYGVLQRIKNELKEETSSLRLKNTEWSEATHVQISINSSDRLLVGLDASSKGELDRTFLMSKINNKIMPAGQLKNEFQIPINLRDDALVLTLLDVDSMHIFEVGSLKNLNLTDSQKEQLKITASKSNVRQCPDEIKKIVPKELQNDCVIVLRYDAPVTYVRAELPTVDFDGNQDARLQFKPVRAGEQVGLVQIAQNVQPRKIENNNEMDPRTTIRVADLKEKEFFFKRTLQDAPATTIFPPGLAGALTIIKFELQESRLVVRKADKVVEFKSGSNETDYEELMSIPVRYFKHETKDASGTNYALSRMVPTTRTDAEYLELDWTRNTLSSAYSPYETLQEQCLRSIGNSDVSEVEMKLEKGILNFTVNYSAGLNAACLVDYQVSNDYNGLAAYQTTARLKERISFKLNDGQTDKAFVAKIPFKVQNELGYGVWTIGKINPTEQGLHGREGQEVNYPVVHDFRNGKTLVYTVTGLEPTAPLAQDIRELYRQTAIDVVNAWDLAYRNAFKGTTLERAGRYVEIRFAGDVGISATVGDLDKNIVHFENKFNDNHGILGVSQVGFNPRSGIVVADSLIVYAGNLQQFVAHSQRNLKISQDWADMKEKFRQQALQKLANEKQAEAEIQKQAGQNSKASNSTEQKTQAATQFAKHLIALAKGQKIDGQSIVNAKKLKLSSTEIIQAAEKMKAAGSTAFKYSTPQMENAWIDRVLRKLSENKTMDETELQGVVAREILASKGHKLSQIQRRQLEKAVRLGDVRSKLNATFKSAPGCMLSERESIARDFANRSFKDALREALFFDLGHEMGHSQGLTHNFIGSFDKANFANADGSESKRNYSSIMDYIEPGKFRWDGVGTYDIHALRASHLGLLEVSKEFKENLEKKGTANKILVNGKYISIGTIQATFAKNGWNNFSGASLNGILKPYKYCTDIHVGYEPVCQRFDYGTSAKEIVESMIQDYEERYVTAYHSWDRNNYGLGTASRVIGGTMMNMLQMRQFMDELLYKVVLQTGSQEEIGDYVQAALKSYIFYNQLVKTPEAKSYFMSQERFLAVPYQYKEEDAEGNETGKVITDIAIVEKRALQDMAIRDDRLDTIGLEYDKTMAMNLLTMKGFPEYKYYAASIIFSYLDFEKYILQMPTERSLTVNTFTEILLDQLQPSFTNDKVTFKGLDGEKASVTPSMRAYAGIFGILNLESTTLFDKDNFANLFKVGTSLGSAPGDRISLSQLGVSDQSKTRLNYWALDNATAANNLFQFASQKNFFIQKENEIAPLMDKLILAQFQNLMSQGKSVAEVEKAKKDLETKLLELNKKGDIISEEIAKQSKDLSIEGQVQNISKLNEQVITIAIGILTQNENAQQAAQQLAAQANRLGEVLPLFAIDQKVLKQTLAKLGQALGSKPETALLKDLGEVVGQLVDGSQTEVSYGMIMKNIDFLSKLTIVTNPEYNR
jgi:hypothetical protein